MRRFLLALALAAAPPAFAKKGDVDFSDPDSVLDGAAFYGFSADAGLSRKTGIPHKVAVGGFQVQYTFESQAYGWGDQTRVSFANEDYVTLTEGLYDALVEHLRTTGYEVVDRDAVVGSHVYANLLGDDEAETKDRKGVFTPTGMKRLNWVTAKPAASPNMLAGLNEELGVDAVLFVQANVAICEVAGSKKERGTKVCLGLPISGSNNAELAGAALKETFRNYPALHITFLMGTRESHGVGGNPTWFPKASGTIQKTGIGDPLVLADTNVRTQVKRGLFGGKYAADLDAFVDATFSLWDTALVLGFAPYEADRAKATKKWGT